MRRPLFHLLLLLLFIAPIMVSGQLKPGHELPIKKAKGPIKLDGVLDEQDWNEASLATGFYLNFPVDTLPPRFQTEGRLTFDDHFLYISFVCFDDETPSVVQSLRRDFEFSLNDAVGITIPDQGNNSGFRKDHHFRRLRRPG